MLWGWCYEEQGAPPYWPWTQPIRSYIQDKDIDQLSSEMGPCAADIAEVVPQVRDKLSDPSANSGQALQSPLALEPEQALFLSAIHLLHFPTRHWHIYLIRICNTIHGSMAK